MLIEHHVVHLRIAVAYAFRQFAFAVQAFSLAHLFGTFLQLIEVFFHFVHSTGGVGSHGISQLLQAELHVVEVRDGLTQFIGNIGQHSLEVTKGYSGVV